MECMKRFLIGQGYMELGMGEEARMEFLKVSPEENTYAIAQAELLSFASHLDPAAQNQSAEEGLALIHSRDDAFNGALIKQTALCLHYAGRSREAYDLTLEFSHNLNWNSDDFYALASFASRNGDFVQAAEDLVEGIPKKLTLGYSHLLVDLDFEPLFRHAAEGDMKIETALSFANPKLSDAVELVLPLAPACDGMLLREMPPRFRSQIRQELTSGFYDMPPTAPESIRREYQQWLKGIAARNAATARRGIKRAREMVLATQYDFAVAAAKRGDFFAARHHAIKSIAARPDSFGLMDSALSPLGLKWFFDDIREAWGEDPTFREVVCSTTPLETLPPQTAMENLNECGPLAKRTAFWVLTRSAIARHYDEKNDVKAWHVEVIRRWPADPAAYHNLLVILEDEQAWDAASAVLEKVPKSFLCMRAAESHRTAIKERRPVIFPKYSRFYGQPDLGGIVSVGAS